MKRHILIIAASFVALAACSKNAGTTGGGGQQAAQGTQSGIDKSLMDTSVKPGDDFDKYANGVWEKNAVIPQDKSNISVFSVINDEAQKREAALVGDIVKSNPSAGSDEARIANYYKAYMDTAGIERRGLTPVKAEIDRIEAIADKGALAEAIGRTLRADTDPLNATNFRTENLLGVFVTQGFNDPTKTVPYIMQGGLGLPDRDYYVSSDPAMAKLRGDYTPYVAKILTLAGLPNAQARAQKIVDAREQDRPGARDLGSQPVRRESEQPVETRRFRQEGARRRLGTPARRGAARQSAGLHYLAAGCGHQDRGARGFAAA